MSLHSHSTRLILEEMLPEAHVSGGSFVETLPQLDELASKERYILYRAVREKATTETVEELLRSADVQTRPPLDRGCEGQRIWPDDYVGSLTHKRGVVLGALVENHIAKSIGIDLEFNETDDELLDHTVRDKEIPPTLDTNIAILVGFSVKEAAYKAYFRLEKRVIDYNDIRLTWETPVKPAIRGTAECPTSVKLKVQCACLDGWVISTALPGPRS